MSKSWSEPGEGPRVRSGLGFIELCEQHFDEAHGNCAQARTAGWGVSSREMVFFFP